MPPRSRWRATGYPVASPFAGVNFCRFRLVHVRDDGLAVITLGHYQSRGKLEPIGQGYNFVSWVALVEEEEAKDEATGEITHKTAKRYEFERCGSNSWRVAEQQHHALLEEWEHKPLDKAEAKNPDQPF